MCGVEQLAIKVIYYGLLYEGGGVDLVSGVIELGKIKVIERLDD